VLEQIPGWQKLVMTDDLLQVETAALLYCFFSQLIEECLAILKASRLPTLHELNCLPNEP
jgi:hypothetical protein